MMQTTKERVLEKVINKLKENVVHSEEFMGRQTLSPVNTKIDHLIQSVQAMIERNETEKDVKGSLSLLAKGLENVRDAITYHMDTATLAAKHYDTCLYVLETLYSENGNSSGDSLKIVKDVDCEAKPSYRVTAPQSHTQTTEHASTAQNPPKPKDHVVVVKTATEQKPKEKAGRFRFGFP